MGNGGARRFGMEEASTSIEDSIKGMVLIVSVSLYLQPCRESGPCLNANWGISVCRLTMRPERKMEGILFSSMALISLGKLRNLGRQI